MSPEEIKRKAKEINDISLDYHLSHAVFACNKQIEETHKRNAETKLNKLRKSLSLAYGRKDIEAMADIKAEIKSLKPAPRIYVEYVPDMSEESGRVVKINNQLVISLPLKLLEKSKNKDGSYNEAGVKALRKKMAHELGHIVLNLEALLSIDNLQGSKFLDPETHRDADIFAEELLRLRHEDHLKPQI